MSTITVSAGRYIGATPMPESDWNTFRMLIGRAVEVATLTTVFKGTGLGQWTDEDGETVHEEAFTIVALDEGRGDVRWLTATLTDLARQYGQDAIAITTGETVLAGMQHTTSV